MRVELLIFIGMIFLIPWGTYQITKRLDRPIQWVIDNLCWLPPVIGAAFFVWAAVKHFSRGG